MAVDTSKFDELQSPTINANSDLGELLRRCKVLASQLSIKPLENWHIWASNGYPEMDGGELLGVRRIDAGRDVRLGNTAIPARQMSAAPKKKEIEGKAFGGLAACPRGFQRGRQTTGDHPP